METINLTKKDIQGNLTIKILKSENSVAISKANFNPETGEQLEDTVIQLFPDQIQAEIENLQAQINEKQTLLDEINSI